LLKDYGSPEFQLWELLGVHSEDSMAPNNIMLIADNASLFVSAYLVNETIVHPNLLENVQTFSLLANVTSDGDVFPAEKQLELFRP
jgi:hypothetical protein